MRLGHGPDARDDPGWCRRTETSWRGAGSRGRPIRDIEVFNAAVAAYRIGGSISSVSRKFKLSQSLRKRMKEMGRDKNGKEDC
jgi:hypothetical protein